MSEQFKPGDVVQLKSGGPLMTVRGVSDSECLCEWFSDSTPKKGSYLHAQLKDPEAGLS